MIEKTLAQYDEESKICRQLFVDKTKDYGTSWRILRTSSLTDQLYIKAARIRSLQENQGESKIDEPIEDAFRGLVNYGIMSMIQLEKKEEDIDLTIEEATQLYDENQKQVRDLMIAKNHDYGEAWRDMRVSSMTDLILMKLLRIRQIEDNDGQTIVSEGMIGNYMDIINYALFSLIKLKENN